MMILVASILFLLGYSIIKSTERRVDRVKSTLDFKLKLSLVNYGSCNNVCKQNNLTLTSLEGKKRICYCSNSQGNVSLHELRVNYTIEEEIFNKPSFFEKGEK
jgi:hypothetical protein